MDYFFVETYVVGLDANVVMLGIHFKMQDLHKYRLMKEIVFSRPKFGLFPDLMPKASGI
jgi:hypothetical protein